jgi:hypothetical protein
MFSNDFYKYLKYFIFSTLVFFQLSAYSYYKFESNSSLTTQQQSQVLQATEEPEVPNIVGLWHFVGHVYRGEVIPPFNDKLVLTFQFFEDGTDILKWYRIGENGFCERTANYQYDGKILSQQVIATNPKNAFECGQDSDMRIGTKSVSSFYKKDTKMYLELPLGEETLIYIWEPALAGTPVPTPIPSAEPTPIPTTEPTPTPMPTSEPTPVPVPTETP